VTKRSDLSDLETADPRAVSPHALQLIVSCDAGVKAMPLPSAKHIVLGRAPEAHVMIPDASVSRRHAQIHRGDPLLIEDIGSKHGTRVLGRLLPKGERVPIPPGSVVQIGAALLIIDVAAGRRERPAPVQPAVRRQPLVEDPVMRNLFGLLESIGPSDLHVIVLGETGTGKELFAEAVHARSTRAGGPFVRVNCAGLSGTLLDSELFGHEKGAFTGADAARPGLFELAHGGTLFLDELGELPHETQAKLLRVVESGEVTRLGGVEARRVDVRYVCATNAALGDLVATGRFRSDLFYRLNGFTLRLPPLRDRPGEILPLAKSFVAAAAAARGVEAPMLAADAEAALMRHRWPGNVRELRTVMERATLLAKGGAIAEQHLFLGDAAPVAMATSGDDKTRILTALAQTGGNQTEAAKLLGISRRTLLNRLDAYGVARPRK
jgi:two-component system response regulator AtoC